MVSILHRPYISYQPSALWDLVFSAASMRVCVISCWQPCGKINSPTWFGNNLGCLSPVFDGLTSTQDAGVSKNRKPVLKASRTTNLGTYDCDAITFCTKTATSPSWSRGMPLSSQNWIATILGSSPRFQLIWRPGRPANSTGKEKS